MINMRQKCPRCGTKHLEHDVRCTGCGLIFERLKLATNKDAKIAIKEGNGKDVVYIKDTPSDLKRSSLILYTIFLGFFGAHCFYVGRYKKAFLMLAFGLVSIIACYLSIKSITPTSIKTLLMLITGIQTFMWLFDVVDVCIFRFKIPVYIKKWKKSYKLLCFCSAILHTVICISKLLRANTERASNFVLFFHFYFYQGWRICRAFDVLLSFSF